jgi:ankyrin repeat protein
MEFENFKMEHIIDLNNSSKKVVKSINANQGLIKTYLNEKRNIQSIQNYVNEINRIVLEAKSSNDKKLCIVKKILMNEALLNVLEAFRNSDVFIRACRIRNKYALKWLLTMNINSCVQDENGMTALMYAVQDPKLSFVVKHLISDSDCLNISDKNGETALFHAVHNITSFKLLLKTNINVNHLNYNNETVLIYCCKNQILKPIKYLIKIANLNVNALDVQEKTAAMYLAENGEYKGIQYLGRRNCKLNFINQYNESALSLLLKNLYTEKNEEFCDKYYRTIVELVELGCNFNIPVDYDGNTAIMVFIIVKDYTSLQYVLKYGKDIDLSIQNYNGQTAEYFIRQQQRNYRRNLINEYPFLTSEVIRDLKSNINLDDILSSFFQGENIPDEVYENCYSYLSNDFYIFNTTKYMKSVGKDIYSEGARKYEGKGHSEHFSFMFIVAIVAAVALL